jgi:hypothetical protein
MENDLLKDLYRRFRKEIEDSPIFRQKKSLNLREDDRQVIEGIKQALKVNYSISGRMQAGEYFLEDTGQIISNSRLVKDTLRDLMNIYNAREFDFDLKIEGYNEYFVKCGFLERIEKELKDIGVNTEELCPGDAA